MDAAEGEGWLEGMWRAIEQHDPSLEPYASMSREQLVEAMRQPGLTGYEHERLQQHFLDKCSKAELDRYNFHLRLTTWLIGDQKACCHEQCVFIAKLAAEVTGKLFDEMPPPGPLHEIN